MKTRSWPVTLLLFIGLILLWVGERIVLGDLRTSADGVAAFLILGTFGWRVMRLMQANSQAKPIERMLLALHAAIIGATLLYLVQSDLFAKVAGQTLDVDSPKLAVVLAALWPAVACPAVIATLMIELSYAGMALAPQLETGRIETARNAGLGLGFVLIFAFATQYVATSSNWKADLSHFRPARASEATKRLAEQLTDPVEVFLFFPPSSDVGPIVQRYFSELTEKTTKLNVTTLDFGLEPVKAKELDVSGNGTVVLRKALRKEAIYLGLDLEKSKAQLRSLDTEVQKRLLQVGRAKRVAYFTAGHGERMREPQGSMRDTCERIMRTLQDQNFDVRPFSGAEGLGVEVPRDATIVVVLGPQQAFTEPEARTIAEYGKRGGRLIIAVDPDAKGASEALLKPLGLELHEETVANDQIYARMSERYSPADRINLMTRTYSSHPIVSRVSRAQAPVVFIGSGWLSERLDKPTDLTVDFSIRAHGASWNDVNSSFQQDPGEDRHPYNLVATVSRRSPSNKPEEELRAIVSADSDWLADLALSNVAANQAVLLDGYKWLIGDEATQGDSSSEVDVPMTRSSGEERLWWFGTIFLAPSLVATLGVVARRRSKKGGKA